MKEKKANDQEKPVKSLNDYARYSNMAFQMLVIMLLGVFGGIKLDEILKLHFPVCTVVLSLSGFLLAMYIGLKDFIHKKK
jgi:hypothetical protein